VHAPFSAYTMQEILCLAAGTLTTSTTRRCSQSSHSDDINSTLVVVSRQLWQQRATAILPNAMN